MDDDRWLTSEERRALKRGGRPGRERVAIVGSRSFAGPSETMSACRAVREYVRALPEGSIVISGGAQGVDAWAEGAAREAGLVVVVVHAAWRRADGSQDKGAGFARNGLIVEIADRVVAFHNGTSNGTMDTVTKAERSGKPVEVVTIAKVSA